VSEIGLGGMYLSITGRPDEAAAIRTIHAALDAGVTFIDTADVYGRGASESVLGTVLGERRRDVVIATKFGAPMADADWQRGASRRWIMRAAEDSLRRLRTDWIDLYQVHFPDPATPIDETLRALDDLVTSGKVRYLGTSNFAAWQIVDAHWTAIREHLARPVSIQHAYNLIRREIAAEVLPAARHLGLGLIPYVPLASGFLTGKYRRGEGAAAGRLVLSPNAGQLLVERNYDRLDALAAFARERGREPVDLAFAWLLSQPEVGPVIASASTADQVAVNARAAEWRLSGDDLAALADA
jgi:aryl-alcohol dehydrogenase-like predicted oxidoreductase